MLLLVNGEDEGLVEEKFSSSSGGVTREKGKSCGPSSPQLFCGCGKPRPGLSETLAAALVDGYALSYNR